MKKAAFTECTGGLVLTKTQKIYHYSNKSKSGNRMEARRTKTAPERNQRDISQKPPKKHPPNYFNILKLQKRFSLDYKNHSRAQYHAQKDTILP